MALTLTPEEAQRLESFHEEFKERSERRAKSSVPAWKLDQIRQMLTEGIPHRQIMRRAHTSNGTLQRIRKQMIDRGELQ